VGQRLERDDKFAVDVSGLDLLKDDGQDWFALVAGDLRPVVDQTLNALPLDRERRGCRPDLEAISPDQ